MSEWVSEYLDGHLHFHPPTRWVLAGLGLLWWTECVRENPVMYSTFWPRYLVVVFHYLYYYDDDDCCGRVAILLLTSNWKRWCCGDWQVLIICSSQPPTICLTTANRDRLRWYIRSAGPYFEIKLIRNVVSHRRCWSLGHARLRRIHIQ